MSLITKEEVKVIVDQSLVEHEAREREGMRDTLDTLLNSLVPNGDPAPHHAYHQAKVEAAKAAKEAEDVKKKLYEYLFHILAERSLEGLARVIRILFWLAVIAGLAKVGIILPNWAEKLL